MHDNETRELMLSLPALSIRQPWAMCILNGKNVENREWRTHFRGRFLIHAGKTMTAPEVEAWRIFVEGFIPDADREWMYRVKTRDIKRGGIVGIADLVDCVTEHTSPWFTGPFGFVLENVRPLPFVPCRGALGFFKMREEAAA